LNKNYFEHNLWIVKITYCYYANITWWKIVAYVRITYFEDIPSSYKRGFFCKIKL